MSETNTSGKRQIKASEIKPGMEVRWVDEGFSHQGTVDRVTADHGGYITRLTSGVFTTGLRSATPVTVLAEPQPEEPTKPGSKVVVNGERFLQCGNYWINVENDDTYYWEGLCAKGEVTIIDSDPSWDKTQ